LREKREEKRRDRGEKEKIMGRQKKKQWPLHKEEEKIAAAPPGTTVYRRNATENCHHQLSHPRSPPQVILLLP
jgi:hypothetical protein